LNLKAGYILTRYPFITQNGIQSIRCFSFVIYSEKYGGIIFDTGSPDESDIFIDKLKKDFNLYPEDIKWVFNTHLIHPDHIGANNLFKNAEFVYSKNEIRDVCYIYDKALNCSIKDIVTLFHIKYPGYKINCFDFEAESLKIYADKHWPLIKEVIEKNALYIEDNPQIPDFIKIIHTPGHTYNHYSFVIDERIMISGDALSMRLVLDIKKPQDNFEPHMDFDEYLNTINKIKEFKGLIVPGHDKPFYADTCLSIDKKVFMLDEIKLC